MKIPYMPTTERRVYAVGYGGQPAHNSATPEQMAYAMARYSRSADSLEQSLEWVKERGDTKTAKFHEDLYFQYGHKSIADMAHVTLAMENVSMLAAAEIEYEPLWDGQERSTRYQYFGLPEPRLRALEADLTRYLPFVHIPRAIENADQDVRDAHAHTITMLFQTYHKLTESLLQRVETAAERNNTLTPALSRNLRARVLDVTRVLLPYATKTSVGQITSARVLERQISRLMSSPYSEIREIAYEMKEAATQPGVAPTLVKYAHGSRFRNNVALKARQFAFDLYKPTAWRDFNYTGSPVYKSSLGEIQLFELPNQPDVETVADLLYAEMHLPYPVLVKFLIKKTTVAERTEFLNECYGERQERGEIIRELSSFGGHRWAVEILADGKTMQDFFRHRRCVQLRQPPLLGYWQLDAQDWWDSGVPAEIEMPDGWANEFNVAQAEARRDIERLGYDPSVAPYLMPLAFKRRALFKLDIAQLQYIIETRTAPQGHFAYRKLAYELYQQMQEQLPFFAQHVRAHPFSRPTLDDFLKR